MKRHKAAPFCIFRVLIILVSFFIGTECVTGETNTSSEQSYIIVPVEIPEILVTGHEHDCSFRVVGVNPDRVVLSYRLVLPSEDKALVEELMNGPFLSEDSDFLEDLVEVTVFEEASDVYETTITVPVESDEQCDSALLVFTVDDRAEHRAIPVSLVHSGSRQEQDNAE